MSVDAETFRALAERVARLEGRLDSVRKGATGPPNRTAALLAEIRAELQVGLTETQANLHAVMRHLGMEEREEDA